MIMFSSTVVAVVLMSAIYESLAEFFMHLIKCGTTFYAFSHDL